MTSFDEIQRKARNIKARHQQRDARYADVTAVRRGDYNEVMRDMFPSDMPTEVIANFVDSAARDLSEVIAPLPSFNCLASNMVQDAARKRADKRTRIAAQYNDHSKLDVQMFDGADHYLSFSYLPFYIEPDFKAKLPRITVETPVGGYPEINRWGETVSFTRYYRKTVGELISAFPDLEMKLRGPQGERDSNAMLDMVRYCDDEITVLFLPNQGGFGSAVPLYSYKHRLGECPVKVVVRPQWDDELRGQWDSVIFVQVARARMALYAMEAVEKSVQAPMMLPTDVQDMPIGGDAVMYTDHPEKARRLPLEIPQGAFAELSSLGDEMRLGARYPEGRTGNLSASVVTGRGVQELAAGFDTQVKTAQTRFSRVLKEVEGLCFKMDETYWPNVEKTIRGTADDSPYEIKYTPGKDIKGDYTIVVEYGFAAGMDPNRAAIMLLQLNGAGVVSKDFMLRQMPFSVNVTDEFTKKDVEDMRGAVLQGLAGLAGAIPQMAASGADPSQIVAKMAQAVALRQKGDSIEDAMMKVFAPPPQQPPAPGGATPPGPPGSEAQPPGPGGAGGPLDQTPPGGGVVPGQEALGPGGKPSLQMMLSRLTSGGTPVSSVGVSRRLPAQ